MEELLCSLGSRSRPEVIGLLPHIKYVPLFGNTLPAPPPPRSLSLIFQHSSLWQTHFLLQNKLDDHFHPRGLAL